ncbi:ubiquitin carboxyl-terminal hydrolase 14 isoform X2 [Hyposmocoma kahamanoa]|nr:ubiquitin carboxyl-terminal hydrolase 14 isoform X2 [Hyposmocoma kahamanoa]
MGSKEEDVPAAPVEQTRFVEDMNESELASALDLPEGLINLGNTCYMNATVQCLKTVPELKNALLSYDKSSTSGTAGDLTSALSETMTALDGGGAGACAGAAARLLRALHATAPRFAERGPGGGLAQQDASECWTEIVRALQQRLPASPGSVSADRSSVVEQYFGGTLDVELVCTEADEPPSRSKESFLQLSCFISQDVKYLQSGLRSKMSEQITKMSQTLGRDAIYTKTCKISRLPAYLTVQFVRFYYKEKEAINAKILKDVKFPLDLDLYELCSPELQERLAPMRSKFKELEDANVESSLSVRNKSHGDSNKKESKRKAVLPYWFEDDIGSNNSGYYRLQAVLTHRGRSSSSGHYVAWVSRGSTWLRCDDDAVTPVTEEEVLKLSGGGDWHCAYLLLYGPKILEIPDEEEPMVTEVNEDTSGNPPTALA